MQNKFLLIGPKNNIENPKITGGVIVLFENLISYSEKHNINYDVIDTNKSNYKNKLLAFISILYLIITKTPKVTHVSLHGTANDYLFIAPFGLVISKIFKKHFSLRKFAGNFIEIYENYPILFQYIITRVLKYSSSNFFETKYLVKYFKKYNKNTFWFPNVRNKQNIKTDIKYKKKFIFLGAISIEKGIEVLSKASNLLSDEYEINLYGVLHDHYTEDYFKNYNVVYKGRLDPNNVSNILSKHDVLILPSFREGYPGVIIEALSAGLPIVATKLKGIQEMVSASSSILVEVDNVIALKKAIEFFNQNNYQEMSNAALKEFNSFDSEIQTTNFFSRIVSKC